MGCSQSLFKNISPACPFNSESHPLPSRTCLFCLSQLKPIPTVDTQELRGMHTWPSKNTVSTLDCTAMPISSLVFYHPAIVSLVQWLAQSKQVMFSVSTPEQERQLCVEAPHYILKHPLSLADTNLIVSVKDPLGAVQLHSLMNLHTLGFFPSPN